MLLNFVNLLLLSKSNFAKPCDLRGSIMKYHSQSCSCGRTVSEVKEGKEVIYICFTIPNLFLPKVCCCGSDLFLRRLLFGVVVQES